jgi:integrase
VEQVGKPTGLFARGRKWYFRMRVPKDLVHVLGNEKIISLNTGDYRTALQRHSEEMAKFHLVVMTERAKLSPQSFKSDNAPEIAYGLVKSYVERYRETSQTVTRAQMQMSSSLEGDPDDFAAELDANLIEMLDPYNEGGQQRTYRVANALASEHGVTYEPGSRFAKELARQVQKALLELAEEERSTFLGINPHPGHLQFSNQVPPSVSVETAAKQFLTQVLLAEPGTDRTKRKREATLKFVANHFGLETSLATISRADGVEFRDLLSEAPTNAKKLFGDLPLRELVKKRTDPRYRVMKRATQTTYLEMAERFFEWAVNEELIVRNPSRDLQSTAEKVAPEDQRDPYTTDELNRIFNAPIYTGCIDDRRRFAKRGPNIIKRSRYWLPLVALFTGARPEEILQFTPDHVQTSEAGTPFFILTRDMKIKTINGRREIPIHPTLASAGFLDFVAEKRSQGSKLLFDDVPVGSDGTRSGIWSKRYATFARSVGVKADLNCFYSFRHTFRDALRAAEVPEEQADKLQGWSNGGKSTGRRYGRGYLADMLAPWIAKVTYPGLELAHLRAC